MNSEEHTMSQWGRLGILMCLVLTTHVWASIGKVSLLKGEASTSRNNQTITLANGIALEKHDVITTQANSQIQLIFEDKTVITLGSESILDIQEYLNDDQESKAKFKFNQGTFKTITGQIGKKSPENFNLETKTATIGIRGTTVVGSIGEGDSPDIIGCSSGRIAVSNENGSVIINAGFQTTVSKIQSPTPPAALSPTLLISSKLTPSVPLAQTSHEVEPVSQSAQTTTLNNTELTPQIDSSSTIQTSQSKQQTATTNSIITQVDTIEKAVDKANDIVSTAQTSQFVYPTFTPRLQASSRDVGTVTLSGLATSFYTSDGTTLSSITDTFMLSIQSGTNNLNRTYSYIALDRTNSFMVDLTKSSDASTMTYKHINQFSIKDFDIYQGWMQTRNTYSNDYVSWGYWAVKLDDDSKLLATSNYWVAGVNADVAKNHIDSLIANNSTTTYAYQGHVIGTVNDGTNSYAINPTKNNAVALNFDFGAGTGTLKNSSYITFQTTASTPQRWFITPSGSMTNGNFSFQNNGNVAINGVTNTSSSSALHGQFYGTSAQAVGGTFSATSGSNTATGVFKAIR